MPEKKSRRGSPLYSARGQRISGLVISTLVMVLMALLYQKGVFTQPDNYLYDLNFRWRGPIPVSGKIVLVLMDDRSAIGLEKQKGDWSRRDTARALENLCAAGAEIIGIDLVMADPDPDPGADAYLARVIDDCNNVVMPRVAATPGGESRVVLDIFQDGIVGEGFVDVQPDSDEVWRRMNYFSVQLLPDGSMQVFPAFALELVRQFLFLEMELNDSDTGNILLGNPAKNRLELPRPELLINYHGDVTAFESISFIDVVLNRFDPDRVNGRLVLLGSSLGVNKDQFLTPFSRTFPLALTDALKDKFDRIANQGFSRKDPGVSCIAHAAETMLSQSIIRRLSKTGVVLLIFAVGSLCLVFYGSRVNPMTGFLVLGALVMLILGVRFAVFARYHVVFDSVPLLMVTAAQFIAGSIFQKSVADRKAARVEALFGRYVSKSVVNELIRDDMDAHFSGTQKELTILFSDLRNFTGLSERLAPGEISILLHTYFGAMIPLVFKHRGTLDKLVGDMIMVFFGAPVPVPDHPAAAARCALDMQQTLEILRQNRSDVRGAGQLWSGIGINTGQVVVGNMGSDDFIDYTVIGDPVNIASRLESLNKVYGTRIIISESTNRCLEHQFLVRKLDRVRVRGKQDAVTIYELMGELSGAGQDQKDRAALFESGLEAYQRGEFERAAAIFREGLARFGDDRPSELYLERIAVFRETPPGKNWDGVTVPDHK